MKDQIPKSLRFEVFKRDGFMCRYCGRKPPEVVLHADHVVPKSKNGTTELLNLVTNCSDCNGGKGARLLSVVPPQLPLQGSENLERLQQLKDYAQYLNEMQEIWENWVHEIMVLWATLEGQDMTKEEFLFHPKLKEALRRFVKKLPGPEITEAVKIAFDKFPSNEYNRLKYFCGICWRKIKGDSPSNSNVRETLQQNP